VIFGLTPRGRSAGWLFITEYTEMLPLKGYSIVTFLHSRVAGHCPLRCKLAAHPVAENKLPVADGTLVRTLSVSIRLSVSAGGI